MVDSVDVLRDPRSGDIPIIIFQVVQIYESYWDVPVFAVGGIRYGVSIADPLR